MSCSAEPRTRDLYWPTLGLLLVVLLPACRPKPWERPGSHDSALRFWREHEAALAAALASPPTGSELLTAWKFFLDLTGIEIQGELTHFGWLPNPKTRDDLGRVREWYALHRAELRWDGTAGRVVLQKPAGTQEAPAVDPRVSEVWDRNLRVLERATAPLPVDMKEMKSFFLPPTEISLRFDESTGYPTAETREDLIRLQAWFAGHKDRLYWDDETQTVKASH